MKVVVFEWRFWSWLVSELGATLKGITDWSDARERFKQEKIVQRFPQLEGLYMLLH